VKFGILDVLYESEFLFINEKSPILGLFSLIFYLLSSLCLLLSGTLTIKIIQYY